MNGTNYEVPHCGAFSTPHSHPSCAQILASGSCFQIPLAWIGVSHRHTCVKLFWLQPRILSADSGVWNAHLAYSHLRIYIQSSRIRLYLSPDPVSILKPPLTSSTEMSLSDRPNLVVYFSNFLLTLQVATFLTI